MFDTSHLIFLDGAMGTMLQTAGLQPGELPELLALNRPELLTSIHRQYIEAGADIVYANTFGANCRKLAKLGVTVEELVKSGRMPQDQFNQYAQIANQLVGGGAFK